MPDRRTFVLDENVAIWSWTLCQVTRQGGRFTVVEPRTDELRVVKLLLGIYEKRLRYGLSLELESRYREQYEALRASNIPLLGSDLIGHLDQARDDKRLRYAKSPLPLPLPPKFPKKDQFLVNLCAKFGCNLVTEDGRLRTALARDNLVGKLGFTVLGLNEALEFVDRVRSPG